MKRTTTLPGLEGKLDQEMTLTLMSSEDHSVAVLHDGEGAKLDVGQRDPLAVDLDPHPLEQGHLDAGQPDGDGPGPAEGQRISGVVGDPDGEARVSFLLAVLRQQVLAAALEVEDPAVEGLVVRVTEHGADALLELALRTALAVFLDQLRAGRTLVRTSRCRALDFAVDVAGAAVAAVLPGLAYGVGDALVGAADGLASDLRHWRSHCRKVLLVRAFEAERATLARSLALVGQRTQQLRTGLPRALHGQ